MPFTEEQHQKGQEHVKACLAETGADPENVKKIKAGDFSPNDEKTQVTFFRKYSADSISDTSEIY